MQKIEVLSNLSHNIFSGNFPRNPTANCYLHVQLIEIRMDMGETNNVQNRPELARKMFMITLRKTDKLFDLKILNQLSVHYHKFNHCITQ